MATTVNFPSPSVGTVLCAFLKSTGLRITEVCHMLLASIDRYTSDLLNIVVPPISRDHLHIHIVYFYIKYLEVSDSSRGTTPLSNSGELPEIIV